jgi:hypothetical protein
MKLCFEFILFHENADGTTTFFSVPHRRGTTERER